MNSAAEAGPLVLLGEVGFQGDVGRDDYAATLVEGLRLLSAALKRRLTKMGARVVMVAPADRGRLASSPFHWGNWFAGAAREALVGRAGNHSPSGLGWGGPGALALIGDEALRRILGPEPGEVVANNRFSTDAFVVAPGSRTASGPALDRALDSLAGCPADNAAARCLEDGGFRVRDVADQPFARFDVDTPLDLALLSLAASLPSAPRLDPEVIKFVSAATLPVGRRLLVPNLNEIGAVMRDRRARLVVTGRVPARTVQLLETETACRVRWFVEERGMRSAREERPRSLLARWVEERGASSLVAELARLGDAVILDSRVLMAAIAGSSDDGLWPGAEERFAADFGDGARITTPWLRELVEAAAASSATFLMGGHTLVSDGLHLLVEAAWAGR